MDEKIRVCLVTSGVERLPEGTAEAISEFADFRAKRCETPQALLETFPDAEVLWMFGPNLCLKPEALDNMPNVKALMRSGSGLDALPVEWAKSHGVGVYNTPESIAECVAEHAVALLFSYARQISQYNARAKAGYEWGKVEGMDWHLSHRTLGLIGYGCIARLVEKMVSGFGMKVIHHDPFQPDSVDLDELLAASDFVSVHCPLTPETEGIVNADFINKMKDGAYFINTSRGTVVNEKALADAIDNNKIAGAALDVFVKEPLPADNPLLHVKYPERLRLAPHAAWASVEARERLVQQIADNIAKGY